MFSSNIDIDEDSVLSQLDGYDSSDPNQSYFDTFIKIPNYNNRSFNENNNQNTINKNEQEKNKIINDVEDLVKCYICLERVKEPKLCNFCHRLACGACIMKWLEVKKKCGFCCQLTTRSDFIDVSFMKDISKLIDYNKILEEKKENLEEQNKILNKKLNDKLCNKHKEKILYYCFNCNEKLCGFCTSITNEESKIHIDHKIIEYSETEKLKNNVIINEMDNKRKNQK